jgi:hypothetical protein
MMEPARLPPVVLSPSQVQDMQWAFAALAAALAEHPSLDVRHMRHLSAPAAPSTRRVAVRCDVAGDPAWTLAMARRAARQALPATFFLNHREAYFGSAGWLEAFLVAGPELGLKLVPWMAGDPAPEQAAAMIGTSVEWLRSRCVDLRGVAFDPPCWGVAAEGYELFHGWGVGGRTHAGNIPLQTVDPAALGIAYTTLFGHPVTADAALAETYFALTTASTYAATTLRHAYWGNNPLWDWDATTTIAYCGNGAWVRYHGTSADRPETHWNVESLVSWLATMPSAGRTIFLFDPRLMAD